MTTKVLAAMEMDAAAIKHYRQIGSESETIYEARGSLKHATLSTPQGDYACSVRGYMATVAFRANGGSRERIVGNFAIEE